MENNLCHKDEIECCPECQKKILEVDAIFCSNCGFNLIEKKENITKYELLFNAFINIPLVFIIIFLGLPLLGVINNFKHYIKIGLGLILLFLICFLIAYVIIFIGFIKNQKNRKISKKFYNSSFILPIVLFAIKICYQLLIN